MNFDLPESHREIQRSVREFCLRHVAPGGRGRDESGAFPVELAPALAELGLLGLGVSEAHGGAALDTLASVVAVEEIARHDGALAYCIAIHNELAVGHVARFGRDELRARYLPDAASGRSLGTAVLGLDASSGHLTATRRGARWTLDGSARIAPLGADAGFAVVLARSEGGATAFVVDRGTEGFRSERLSETLGLRASDPAVLSFEGCAVDDAQRIGEVGHGADDAARSLARAGACIAAVSLGLGEGALESAVRYAKDRQQFGRPIADFQAIQWMIADARVELDAARLLVQRAAAACDAEEGSALAAATARLYAGEVASRVCSRALQIHGGNGYTREFPVERQLRDAKLCELCMGGVDAQRAIVSRDLLAG